MRVITLNVNGIRSAGRKGFFDWLASQEADVVCLQEVRAHHPTLAEPLFNPSGYHCFYVEAQKKGYSGVAIYTRKPVENVVIQLGYPLSDQEGRYVEVELGGIRYISLYLPSGSSGEVRQAEKIAFMDFFGPYLQAEAKKSKPLIIAGDWNIAHTKKDLKNWRGNQKSSGFLPQERAWLDRVLGEWGYCDTFRVLHPEAEQYTWWSARNKKAWETNAGWRIDYQIVSASLKSTLKAARIYTEQRFSDHAPVIVDYDF